MKTDITDLSDKDWMKLLKDNPVTIQDFKPMEQLKDEIEMLKLPELLEDLPNCDVIIKGTPYVVIEMPYIIPNTRINIPYQNIIPDTIIEIPNNYTPPELTTTDICQGCINNVGNGGSGNCNCANPNTNITY